MLNVETIKQATQEKPDFGHITNFLGNRTRGRFDTNLVWLQYAMEKKGTALPMESLIGYFQNLEKAGAGTLVAKRKGGKPSRFIWGYNLKDVAAAAAGAIQPDSIKAVPPRKNTKPTKRTKRAYKRKPVQVSVIPTISPTPVLSKKSQVAPSVENGGSIAITLNIPRKNLTSNDLMEILSLAERLK